MQYATIFCLLFRLSQYGVRVFYYIKEYEEKKDSSNMNSEDWVKIAKDVRENYDAYDSFVILHGTDTMSYTASILSFMFQNLQKTVILTGSQVMKINVFEYFSTSDYKLFSNYRYQFLNNVMMAVIMYLVL